MGTLHCIRHPKYDGTGTPILSCRTCCERFVTRIKAGQPADFDVVKWLKDKEHAVRGYNPSK